MEAHSCSTRHHDGNRRPGLGKRSTARAPDCTVCTATRRVRTNNKCNARSNARFPETGTQLSYRSPSG
eukprot:468223-Pleurochrysis_carterae.AAC.1